MRLFVLLLCLPAAFAINRDLLYHSWPAKWCWPAGADPYNYGVYHFRKTFELKSVPEKFLIHVTADNRYQLYVNGERVAWGPARGDLFHWRYESVDIAQWLRPGRNVLAAVVWNDGRYRAVAQISNRTGLLVQGDGEAEQVVNTPGGWVAVENEAYSPLPITYEMVRGYVAIPPGEEVDAANYPWGWEQPDYDDSAWKPVEAGRNGAPRETVDAPNRWFLAPRPIPLMEETPIRLARVRRAERPFRTRSDCHGWGASPNIELFPTVLGVDSAAPRFRRVRIEPHLGKLESAKGVVPHPRGEVRAELIRGPGGELAARVDPSAGVSGEIHWGAGLAPSDRVSTG